jgi:DNA repair exonuclease SbcCD nuclease subunit
VKKDQRVVAIACADIHLCHTAPVCRSGEPDWYRAMARPLDQLRALQEKYDCPILCAGDVFDRWNSPPELINWAIKHMPKQVYAIPGQHDLPQHRLEDVRKSAYWTLVEAGAIENIPNNSELIFHINMDRDFVVQGFPWGKEIEFPEELKDNNHDLHIAVAHQYRWIQGHHYPGADPNQKVVAAAKQLKAFDVCIFGDNHSGFLTTIGTTTYVFNCGTLMRRKTDEADYKPQVGLIYSDGSVVPHFLDTTLDELDETVKEPSAQGSLDARQFLERLRGLSNNSLDFRVALERFITDTRVADNVKAVLVEALGD